MTLLTTPTPILSPVKTSLNCHPTKWPLSLSRGGCLPETLTTRHWKNFGLLQSGQLMEGGFTWRFSCILNDERSKLEMLLKHNPTWDYKSVLSITKGWMSAIFIILLPFFLIFLKIRLFTSL